MPTKKPISVMQVVSGLRPAGAERIAVSLANGLADREYDSHLLASREEGPLANDVRSDVRCWCAQRRRRWDISGIRRIASYIDEHGINIVHTHNHDSSYLLRVVLRFCRRRPFHIVHDHHGPAVNDRKLAVRDWLMLRHVDGYIAVTEELRDRATRLLGLDGSRCVYLANGVEILSDSPAWNGVPTVIQVAGLKWPKNHELAMRAAALVREKCPDLKWMCVGDVADPPTEYVQGVLASIKTLDLSNCVELLGQRSDVRSLCHRAHVGILTSDYEALPVSLLEYMAEGLPAVITNVGQGPVIIRDAQAGAVVSTGDADGIADDVLKLLHDPKAAYEKGRNGRAYAVRHFSMAEMTKQVHQFYQRLINMAEART